MVDVNKRAVWLAEENAKRNRANNVVVRRGFLYEPVKNMNFAAVLCNPPVSAGMETVSPIITNAPQRLQGEGSLQLVVRSKKGGKRLFGMMAEAFGSVEVLAKQSGYMVLLSKKS
jgi:16S rRNA (guanine1207-N2)-methyltransferase